VKHLVVGLGEVGAALRKVLDCDGHDPAKDIFAGDGPHAFLHICIPYSKDFKPIVEHYIDRFRPAFTVVHSTVPVGTCNSLGIAHSPIRGKHPNLAKSLKAFTKFVAGPGSQQIAAELREYGIDAVAWPDSRDTEAQKLWDLAQYYWSIMIMREIHAYCDREGLDFDHVYTEGNRAYNAGYMDLGHPEFVRPVLKFQPGPTGGHCVRQNVPMLQELIPELLRQREELFMEMEAQRA
jgi:hypothetical protein